MFKFGFLRKKIQSTQNPSELLVYFFDIIMKIELRPFYHCLCTCAWKIRFFDHKVKKYFWLP